MVIVMPKIPSIVVLTGPMGCGKSAAGHFFADLGVPIIELDILAHQVMRAKTEIGQALRAHFPSELFAKDGEIIRPSLRAYILEHPEEKRWLEQTVHPGVTRTLASTLDTLDTPYVMVITPLYHGLLSPLPPHRLCMMEAPDPNIRDRVMARPHANQDALALAVLQAKQLPKHDEVDDWLKNDGTLEALKQSVQTLHQHYTTLFSHST